MSSYKSKFITFEGGEGSGKSTQSKLLYEYLINKGIKAVHTREVGGTVEAEAIRNLLVHRELYPISELLLIMAARYEHINKVIIPALLDGKWVICDRFVDSTACYQSCALGSDDTGGDAGLTMEDIYELHNKLMKDLNNKAIMPDLTFFMDVPPNLGLDRASIRGEGNKFEDKNLDFHKRIYAKFKTLCAAHKDRITIIEGSTKKIEEIHRQIINYIFY